MSIINDAAAWASTLQMKDIPPTVKEKTRHQVLNMLAAVMAGLQTKMGQKLNSAITGSGGSYWSFNRGRSYTLDEAVILNGSLGMILDYDDYLFMGHTGHSSVISSLLLADKEQKNMSELIPAVVSSNEVAGRVGAATFFGPRNGQLWSYIHLAGGAVAAARILGLDAEETAHAISLSLYQPVLPLYPGFMGGESKVTTAATPTQTGVQSAFMARSGIAGNKSILEQERGFLDEIGVVRLDVLLSGWGQSWVTETIAFKPYPGCAYLDTALDGLKEICERINEERGNMLQAEEVEDVLVEASIFTEGMDQLARAYRDNNPLKPININFSIASSLAIAILNGRVTPESLEPDYLEENRGPILAMMSKVRLVHDWKCTLEAVRIIDENLDLKTLLGSLPFSQLRTIRKQLKNNSQTPDLNIGQLLREFRPGPAIRWLSGFLRFRRRLKSNPALAYDMGNIKTDQLRLPFPAKVSVRLKGGQVYEAYRTIPCGAPGGPVYLEEVRDKWLREAVPLVGEERAGKVMNLILENDAPVAEILDTLKFFK